jgi:hypothetical protein
MMPNAIGRRSSRVEEMPIQHSIRAKKLRLELLRRKLDTMKATEAESLRQSIIHQIAKLEDELGLGAEGYI